LICSSNVVPQKYVASPQTMRPMSPYWARFTASRYRRSVRVWKSTRNAFCFSVALRPLSSTVRQPGTSTATGLATYTCLPASTASRACIGWKYGGLSIATASTSPASTFL